ncbi:unnamed protein product [Didymodactylos carnosus]|uniref:Prefoldin subunit 2 n=1 Tax=Didymodactylos carnosus TaxID=1234261 RepID=A0A813XHQ5_9BILA|nr:unnamed protein product [Didymodactylos carnosus]CAF0880641.1 unnamed protein product [Didymodactylos carnosus]CAF3657651.1 unnamed protein product [Didymodactylos carnosus]CAF3664348.1 unnamed protein product [Didymodactylos carnosus]
MATKSKSKTGGTSLTNEQQQQIVSGFQALREEQTQLVSKTQDLEMDLKEHDLVLSTLKTITDKQRRCYRMIGGVLIEHTTGEVLPAVESNREQIKNVIDTYKQKSEEKSKEIQAYKEKYDIHFANERQPQLTNSSSDSTSESTKEQAKDSSSSTNQTQNSANKDVKSSKSSGVLVDNDS